MESLEAIVDVVMFHRYGQIKSVFNKNGFFELKYNSMCKRNMAQSKMKKPSKELQSYFEDYSENAKAYAWLAGSACYRCNPGYTDPGTVFELREYEVENFQIDFAKLSQTDKHILLMHVTPLLEETIGATRRTLGWFIVSYL